MMTSEMLLNGIQPLHRKSEWMKLWLEDREYLSIRNCTAASARSMLPRRPPSSAPTISRSSNPCANVPLNAVIPVIFTRLAVDKRKEARKIPGLFRGG